MDIKVSHIPGVDVLTCIIPLRVASDRLDAIERLEFHKQDVSLPSDIGFLVIDDGSPREKSEKVEEKCAELGLGYIRLDTELEEFSVGRCRNIGAMYSKSKYILMQDVDLVPYQGFYRDLLDEIEIQGLDFDIKKFLMVPYVFLTEEGTRKFFSLPPEKRQKKILHYALLNDPDYIEKLSTGTSANLYDRHWYLSRGGNSDDFEGWGYEDLEFNTRLIRHLNFFPTPKNWQLQKYNFNTVLSYESWKAVYRLFGDMLFSKGVFFVHAWHPVVKGGTYMQRGSYNRSLFEKKMKRFASNRAEPDPLPDKNSGVTLLLSKNAFTFSRNIAPFLGDVIEPDNDLLAGGSSLQEFRSRNHFDRVVFHNPYSSEVMKNIYKEAVSLGMNFVVCERGGLPGSLFYDSSGFLVDSIYYKEDKWDEDILEEDRLEVIDYIKGLKNESTSLEGQPQRVGKDKTKELMGVKRSDKVLFVPFQRPGDSVTKNFLGELGEYEKFVSLVEQVANSIPDNWVVIAKTHPLEDVDLAENSKVLYANKFHVKDLLDIADTVLTFNSGVGLEAMAWELPVLLAGKAYYYNPSINTEVSNLDDVLSSIDSPKKPDREKIIRFYKYLVKDYYSFGVFKTKPVKMEDGSRMTATIGVEHTQIIWPERSFSKLLSCNERAKVSWESYLFDRYRYAEGLPKKDNASGADKVEARRVGGNVQDDKNAAALRKRRIKKLLNNPRQYCFDSKHYLLRKAAAVFFS